MYHLGKCSLDLKGKLVEEGEKKLEEVMANLVVQEQRSPVPGRQPVSFFSSVFHRFFLSFAESLQAILDNSVKSLEEEEELLPGRKLLLFLACLSAHGSLRQLQRTPSEQDLLLHAKFIRFVESNNLREETRRRRREEKTRSRAMEDWE